jgi:hypothetical protein
MELQFVGSGDAFGSGGRFNMGSRVCDERGAFLVASHSVPSAVARQ